MASPQYSGDFVMDDVTIISSAGVSYNIQTLIIEINVYESIKTPWLSGTILIEDTTGLVETAPIIGQERVLFSFATSKDHDKIDFTKYQGVVTRISKRTTSNLTSQTYILEFSTLERMKNARTKVSKSFEGTTDLIVKDILTDKNYINNPKPLELEPTQGVRKYVMPNISPYSCIRMMGKESITSENRTGFLFYENHRGFNFRSISSLLQSKAGVPHPVKRIFIHGPPIGATEARFHAMTMLQFEILVGGNTFIKLQQGALCSKMIKHDIYNKNFGEYHFDYLNSFSDNPHTMSTENEFGPLISDMKMDETEKKITEFPDSKCFLTTSSSTDLYTEGKTDSQIEKWLQTGLSNKHQSENLTNMITIMGDSSIAAGDLIEIRIPSSLPGKKKVPERDQMDPYLSGRYLAQAVRHKINPRQQHYVTFIEAAKDSIYPKLPAMDQDFSWTEEPKKESNSLDVAEASSFDLQSSTASIFT